ncbi:hypothetical protein, partial [Enterococcus faecium]|uniref:hypothetical protein n=1 Tax=Enterococcus faecium TaxID=1352 RepID=UPI0037C097AF
MFFYKFYKNKLFLILEHARLKHVIIFESWRKMEKKKMNIEQYGFDVLMPMLLPAILAQGGAALAVALRTKDTKLRALG